MPQTNVFLQWTVDLLANGRYILTALGASAGTEIQRKPGSIPPFVDDPTVRKRLLVAAYRDAGQTRPDEWVITRYSDSDLYM